MHRGITLVFIPLLTLSANVMAKFESAFQLYGSVRAYHLDELYDNNAEKYTAVINRCRDLQPANPSPSTVFIFLSPQHLCKSDLALSTFIGCSARGTLRTIFMDEVHVHVHQGLSFRMQCRELRDKFFVPCQACMHPRDRSSFVPNVFALTATFPNSYLRGLQQLTSISFDDESVMRGEVDDFLNTDIDMFQVICNKGDYVKVGVSGMVDALKADCENKGIIFCNSRAKAGHFGSELERKLNEAKKDFDVIVITGALNKDEKFWRIRIFTGDENEFVGECSFRLPGRSFH